MRRITTRKRLAFAARRSQRMSDVGRQLESEIGGYLESLKAGERILSYARHAPNSAEDADGKDFTVRAVYGGVPAERSFGVTISLQSWSRSKRLHPDTPQFCFPVGTRKDTIIARILSLFAEREPDKPVAAAS